MAKQYDDWDSFWHWLTPEDQDRIANTVQECVDQINAELEASGLSVEELQKLLTERDVPPFAVYG